jgi:hypothetical protein
MLAELAFILHIQNKIMNFIKILITIIIAVAIPFVIYAVICLAASLVFQPTFAEMTDNLGGLFGVITFFYLMFVGAFGEDLYDSIWRN